MIHFTVDTADSCDNFIHFIGTWRKKWNAAWRLDAAPAVSNLFWAKNMGSILRYPFEDVTIIRKNGATVKGDQES